MRDTSSKFSISAYRQREIYVKKATNEPFHTELYGFNCLECGLE